VKAATPLEIFDATVKALTDAGGSQRHLPPEVDIYIIYVLYIYTLYNI